ncbi:thiamine phosphate synthase [Solimonas sp. SE-A11]|uniref:thiamine phosphate synthase n=1 Tax=Solimonas sp. SE-A11 TaxID=3054954 RepID=UPI00259D2B4B|nr:thiamine phosphate synthase [Solimonas sp. SE-A11]MDM4770360.1 thiamine phosphate synthase [Solimonas sp. SE-A11]
MKHLPPLSAPLRGLYAITSEAICRSPGRLVASAAEALAGGARLLQYRDKWHDAATRERNAHALRGLCHEFGALFIVNDDPALAEAVDADGVHVGAADAPLAEARRRLGPRAIIGVSCANSLERARAAAAAGANYVAFGRFFESGTKPDAPQADLALLQAARAAIGLPICVIGGLLPSNTAPLIAAGADMAAAVEGIFGATDVEARAREYSRLFG